MTSCTIPTACNSASMVPAPSNDAQCLNTAQLIAWARFEPPESTTNSALMPEQ